MKKILQRVSKVVMACLLCGMCVLFSGCFPPKIFEKLDVRFYDFEDTWVCDTEELKIALETKGRKERDLFTVLTLNGEEMEVYIYIGGAGEPGTIRIYKGREIYGLEKPNPELSYEEYLEREALKESHLIFELIFHTPYYWKADKYVTWEIVRENPELVGEKSFVGKEYVLNRQGV